MISLQTRKASVDSIATSGSSTCLATTIRPLSDGQLTLREDSLSSPIDPGCVKTLFESRFGANQLDFRKLQFAKALISLKLKFRRFGFNLDLIRSLTFSHNLDPEPTSDGLKLPGAQ